MRNRIAAALGAAIAALTLATGSADEAGLARLREAFGQLQPTFDLLPLGPAAVRGGSGSLVAFADIAFEGGGTGVIELHRDAGGSETVWIAVPDTAWRREHAPIGFYGWHGFERSGAGRWQEQRRPGMVSAPRFPADRDRPPLLRNSGAWAAWDEYYEQAFWRGEDPPHWTPIAILSDPDAWIGDVHDAMNDGRHAEAGLLVDHLRPRRGDDLTDRAMEIWQPVTLRGAVTRAEFTGGDLGVDHTYAYHVNGMTFHPDLLAGEVTDPRWPGIDWDIKVSPDRDVRYLLSDRTAGDPYWNDLMEVEIEHFAVPPAYRPAAGDWVQAMGRWITDNGHGFRTEIHPPELLVSSRHGPGPETVARVVATGAWFGEDLSFVVYPPKRPSPQAVLRWEFTPEPLRRVNVDAALDVSGFRGRTLRRMLTSGDTVEYGVGSELLRRFTMLLDEGALPASLVRTRDSAPIDVAGWPAGNPNQLICTIRANSDDFIVLHNSGSVSMTSESGHLSRIHVWWEDASAELRGVVRRPGGAPARGTSVYYRESGTPPVSWLSVPTDASGGYVIARLNTGVSYDFRPAGSGWDFRMPRATRSFSRGPATINFTADASSLAERAPMAPPRLPPLDPLAQRRAALASALGRSAERRASADSPEARMRQSALDQLTSRGLRVAGPDILAVRNNGFGRADRGRLVVSLSALVGADGRPVPSLDAAYEEFAPELRDLGRRLGVDDAELERPIRLTARAGMGAQNAVVRATMLLGNRSVGFRQAGPVESTTNGEGLAAFRVEAGTHAEDVIIQVEVVSNPANPWFLPKVVAFSGSLGPAATGDDFVPAVEYALLPDVVPSTLRVGFDPMRIKAPAVSLGGPGGRAVPVQPAPFQAKARDDRSLPGGWSEAEELLEFRRDFLEHDRVARTAPQPGIPAQPLGERRAALDKRQLDMLRQRLAAQSTARLAAPRAGILPALPAAPKQVERGKAGDPARAGQQTAPSKGDEPAKTGQGVGGRPIVVNGAALAQAGAVASDGTLSSALIPPSTKDPKGVPYARWAATSVKSELDFTVNASSSGSYTLYLSFLKMRDGAPVAVFVNGERAGTPFDPTGNAGAAKISFGRVELRAGANEIALRLEPVQGKDRKGASVAVLQILLEPWR